MEDDVSPSSLAILYTSSYARQWASDTTIKTSTYPLIASTSSRNSSSEPQAIRLTPSVNPKMYNWPGTRGGWQGRMQGYRGPDDESFIGRREVMENVWNPFSRGLSPADYAKEYFGNSWSGRAGLERHAAMQQQWMGLQSGPHNPAGNRAPWTGGLM